MHGVSVSQRQISHVGGTHPCDTLILLILYISCYQSANGAEFQNAKAAEISAQFQITQTFKAAYHPAANGLAEKATELLDVIRSLVNDLHDNWKDWLPQITATIMSSVYDSSCKSHYTLYGVGKRLPYDLLINTPQPVYNIEDYAQQLIHVFSTLHTNVWEKLMATKAKMLAKQLKSATPVEIKQRHSNDSVTRRHI